MGLSDSFIDEIRGILPESEATALIDALENSEPSVSVRINSHKGTCIPENAKCVPWCNDGFYLEERPQFTFDPALHCGKYYVQDASSMFLAYAIEKLTEKSTPIRYLDLCAAPGGKTTTAINALPQNSLIVANEIMSGRAQILRENIIKWGNPYCVVTNNDSRAYSKLTHFFDIIATDVPCSGEGMMRKDDEAVAQWTPALVKECAERQREIVGNAWEALRPGGYLIYSTCTFNRMENEEIVEYMINEFGAESIDLNIPTGWNIYPSIDSSIHGYHFFPHRTKGEGLFLAVVRKPEDEPQQIIKTSAKKKGKKETPQQVPKEVRTWLQDTSSMHLNAIGDTINAIPTKYVDEMGILLENLRVIYHGCEIATIKGRDLIPSHALALNECTNPSTFSGCEVDYPTAIAYLRGEAITIDAPKGFILIKYQEQELGFVKNIGNRCNNLYPKEWRIKSTHIPPAPPQIL